jgi:hypothetical protein
VPYATPLDPPLVVETLRSPFSYSRMDLWFYESLPMKDSRNGNAALELQKFRYYPFPGVRDHLLLTHWGLRGAKLFFHAMKG